MKHTTFVRRMERRSQVEKREIKEIKEMTDILRIQRFMVSSERNSQGSSALRVGWSMS